jgi:hypothetical protein
MILQVARIACGETAPDLDDDMIPGRSRLSRVDQPAHIQNSVDMETLFVLEAVVGAVLGIFPAMVARAG